MANTYTLIASNTLSSSAASVTFSSIPSTYTDLVLRCSFVDAGATGVQPMGAGTYGLRITGVSGTTSQRFIRGNGSAASSSSISGLYMADINGTGSTFTSVEIYIPSYTASQNKPISSFSAAEANATTAYISAVAALYQNTSAISSFSLDLLGDSFAVGSSFFLYGLKNS